MKNIVTSTGVCIRIVMTMLALFPLGVSQTLLAQEVNNYYTRFTPEGRQSVGATDGYYKDAHVWVYTSNFAKRFGMPEKWIDDELEGAEALAYRIDINANKIVCSIFNDQITCTPSTKSVLDMYIDDAANLPWNTETRFESRYGRKSIGMLVPQNDNDYSTWWNRVTKRGGQYKLGLDVVYITGAKRITSNPSVLEYDRDIYKDLDYVSVSTSRNFTELRGINIDIDTPKIKENGWIAYYEGTLAHRIKVPNSFMQRIDEHEKAQRAPNSLFKAMRNHLSNTNQTTQ